jgi:glycosyltransferase involved in cell wall biosynthesis
MSRPQAAPITFCIFSFNRGRFLENCVQSIEHCMEGPEIVVFDDRSDDPETLRTLESLGKRHKLVTSAKINPIKHGGLYSNMQSALDMLQDRELLGFLQDDTQIVRAVTQAEIRNLADIFSDTPDLGFLHPCFIRGFEQQRRPVTMLPGPDANLYYRKNMGQSAGVHYSDLLITSPARLLRRGWRFLQSEPENDRQARALFGPMAYTRFPFAMWLPEVPAFRGKKKSWTLRVAERRKNCGFYPFRIWSEEESRNFMHRSANDLPVAERYLSCIAHEPPKPWTYNPLTGYRWLQHVNALEMFLRKHLLKG